MNRRGYFNVGFGTTLNHHPLCFDVRSFYRLEARVRGGVFNIWGCRFRYRPRNFVQPTIEEEIVSLVKNSKGIRFLARATLSTTATS